MNQSLQKLQTYPFEKLSLLIKNESPNANYDPISLAIGEPKHPTPNIIMDAVANNLDQLAKYPTTKGSVELRQACTDWLINRFQLNNNFIDHENNILPVNGTREALFALAQCIINQSKKPVVLIPNPFYQIYEGAALLAGAEPIYYDCSVVNGDIPALWEISEDIWQHCQLLYICTPGNPTGEIAPEKTIKKLIQHSSKHDFVIASDECYSEIYASNSIPPMGLLHHAQNMGNSELENCIAFYSLSKRSNAPGLRSGFIAGSKQIIEQFFKYRTYHGCAMPLPTQYASIAAWSDEIHVASNRQLYDQKFKSVIEILNSALACQQPDAGFYLWPTLQMDEIEFCKLLYTKKNVLSLPGSYLAREVNGYNPGKNRVRLALVAKHEECVEAAQRIRDLLEEI